MIIKIIKWNSLLSQEKVVFLNLSTLTMFKIIFDDDDCYSNHNGHIKNETTVWRVS